MGRWHYPRWRRILMQVALCAIFAGSVALASLVTHQRLSVGSTPLEGTRWYGRIGVRAPAGWALETENQGPILLVAQEPNQLLDGDEKPGRRLTVRHKQLDAAVPAADYLKSSGLLLGTHALLIDGVSPIGPITMAGTTGILLPVIRPVGLSLFAPPTYETQWIACVVRPNGLAITLQLDCPQGSDLETDRQSLRDIAASIEVRDPLGND